MNKKYEITYCIPLEYGAIGIEAKDNYVMVDYSALEIMIVSLIKCGFTIVLVREVER